MRKKLGIAIVALGVVGVAVLFCLACYSKAHPNAAREACERNLREFDRAVEQFETTNNTQAVVQSTNRVPGESQGSSSVRR
jgi:Tfp pilus assembly protein PilE